MLPLGALYFEINEDFNLHLKVSLEEEEKLSLDQVAQVRKEIARRFGDVGHISSLIGSRAEMHVQGAYAVWEWDFDLPKLIYDEQRSAPEAMGAILDAVVPRLV